jgi:polar amino acid transport system substrate-binding protein
MACLFLAGLLSIMFYPLDREAGPACEEHAALPPPPPDTSNRVLRFASDPWPPYAGDAGAESKGYIVELLDAAFTPLGYRVEFVNRPWSRCIEEVQAGQLTGLAGADLDEVKGFVFPRLPVGLTRPCFFTRAGSSWTFTGMESLAAIRLGYIQDYTYEARLDEYLRLHRDSAKVLAVTGIDALKRLLEALRAGHIDALVENAPVVYWTLAALQWSPAEVREAGAPRRGVLLYIPFSPALAESPHLARLLDQRVQELRADGSFGRILRRYGVVDWSETSREGESGGAATNQTNGVHP